MKLKDIAFKVLKENKLRSGIFVRELLKGLNITKYEIIGEGQHGVVVKLPNDKCIKLTSSTPEYNIVKKLEGLSLKTLPKIYKSGEISGIYYYYRDFYEPISDDLVDDIDSNMDEIYDFLEERRNWDAAKSNTNLEYEFDGKFLKFLSQLKRDLHKLGLLPLKWDVEGLSLNLMQDGDSFILVDF